MEGGIAAANADHDVVMTPVSHCYFDYCQAKSGEPKAIGGFLPLETVYGFEPVPKTISADKRKQISRRRHALERIFSELRPRAIHDLPCACALAEVTWTDPKLKNWEDFRNRLDTHLQRLQAEGVNYRHPRQTDNAPGNSKP